MAGMLEPWHFRVDDTNLKRYLRDARGRWASGNQAIKRANERSIAWLGAHAAETLGEKVHRFQDRRNPLRLADIVADPEASWATNSGFAFLVEDKVAAISARARAYYRVIEGLPGEEWGSEYWKGRTIRLRFYGPGGFGGQAASYRRSAREITITKGVLAYHYAEQARIDFLKDRKWWEFALEELALKGIHPTRVLQ